jgi:hypothetical protein
LKKKLYYFKSDLKINYFLIKKIIYLII